jgi:hypothetical protein
MPTSALTGKPKMREVGHRTESFRICFQLSPARYRPCLSRRQSRTTPDSATAVREVLPTPVQRDSRSGLYAGCGISRILSGTTNALAPCQLARSTCTTMKKSAKVWLTGSQFHVHHRRIGCGQYEGDHFSPGWCHRRIDIGVETDCRKCGQSMTSTVIRSINLFFRFLPAQKRNPTEEEARFLFLTENGQEDVLANLLYSRTNNCSASAWPNARRNAFSVVWKPRKAREKHATR